MDVRGTVRHHIVELVEAEKSQSEFARKVGATPQNVRNWIAGDSSPSLDKLADIAEAYGLTPGALLEMPGDRELTALTPEEAEVVELMRSMTGAGRAMLVEVARAFKESGSYDAQ